MIKRRKLLIASLSAAMVLGMTAPAGAATGTISDPTGDVRTDSGAPASDTRLDITGVAFTNAADGIEARVSVPQTVPFTDPAWQDDLLLALVLKDDAASGDAGTYQLVVLVADGEAIGLLGTANGIACVMDVTQTATEYVLSGDARCARGLPRSLQYGAVLGSVGGSELVFDQAPDGADLATAVEAVAHGVVQRAAGTDRVLTSIALSNQLFDDGGADAVVLAAAQSFPDALAGGPLAYVNGAPLLLTASTGLDPRTKAEMTRVLAAGGDVFVLGGTAALSDKVVADVRAAGFVPSRVAGVDRFETAIAIADQVEVAASGHDTVLIADGRTFPDALIAGAAAPSVAGVVVLTDGTKMPPSTAKYLGNDSADHVAIGSAAATAAAGVRSITGSGPADLSARVADQLVPRAGIVAVASQTTFADALAGGPFISAFGGPLLLTDPASLSAPVANAITAAAGSLREVVLLGGTAAVTPNVANQIASMLGGA